MYSQETSIALGFGFRCGFLGLLHVEIIQERILREHEAKILVLKTNLVAGTFWSLVSPACLPE